MLHVTLREQMYAFVQKFMLVEERQLVKFFSDWGSKQVAYELTNLKSKSIFHEHPNGKLSLQPRLPSSPRDYDEIIRAVDVMCKLPSKEVKDFETIAYPMDICFLTTEDILYTVTVFNRINWVGKYALLPAARTKMLPNAESDPFNHIAVVDDPSLILKIKELGFSMYVTIDRNGAMKTWKP